MRNAGRWPRQSAKARRIDHKPSFQVAHANLACVDRELRVLAVNPAWIDAFGATTPSLLELIHPADRARVDAELTEIPAAQVREVMGRFSMRDGGYRELTLRVARGGSPTSLLHLSARDVEGPFAELVAVKRRLAALYETMQELVYTGDEQLLLTGMNRAPEGLAINDLVGVPMISFAPPEEREQMQARFDEVLQHQARLAYETSVVYPDGSLHTYSSRLGPILDTQRCVGVMLITHDITAERRAQEATRRFEGLLKDKIQDLFAANVQLAGQHELIMAGELRERTRLSRELDFARSIQAGILPRDLAVPGLDIAAVMQPCTEMGGDYYDIRQTADGCWIGIGDISGHGVSAGLVMLMLQAITAALTDTYPDAMPAEVLIKTNRILHNNVRSRMVRDEHVTATLLRFYQDGRIVFAGAHEELLVLRANTGVCEQIETDGAWLGVVADITASTHNEELRLEPGDTLLLYTDGLTEAIDANNERFGVERVSRALAQTHGRPASQVLEGLLATLHSFCPAPDDDVAVLVLHYAGGAMDAARG